MQHQPEWSKSVYHLFVVIPENKIDFENHLKQNSINPAYHYPVPCHLQKAYENLGYKKGDFPVSEEVSQRIFSLPMHPYLDEKTIYSIVDAMGS